jgi:hypothetical protein
LCVCVQPINHFENITRRKKKTKWNKKKNSNWQM